MDSIIANLRRRRETLDPFRQIGRAPIRIAASEDNVDIILPMFERKRGLYVNLSLFNQNGELVKSINYQVPPEGADIENFWVGYHWDWLVKSERTLWYGTTDWELVMTPSQEVGILRREVILKGAGECVREAIQPLRYGDSKVTKWRKTKDKEYFDEIFKEYDNGVPISRLNELADSMKVNILIKTMLNYEPYKINMNVYEKNVTMYINDGHAFKKLPDIIELDEIPREKYDLMKEINSKICWAVKGMQMYILKKNSNIIKEFISKNKFDPILANDTRFQIALNNMPYVTRFSENLDRLAELMNKNLVVEYDMIAAFTQICEFYIGHPINYGPVLRTNKIIGEGWYYIGTQYMKYNHVFIDHFLHSGAMLPSYVIRYLESLGIKIKIQYGFWGSTLIDTEKKGLFGDHMKKMIEMNNIREYVYVIGCLARAEEYNEITSNYSDAFISRLMEIEPNDKYEKFPDNWVIRSKRNVKTYAHHAGFIMYNYLVFMSIQYSALQKKGIKPLRINVDAFTIEEHQYDSDGNIVTYDCRHKKKTNAKFLNVFKKKEREDIVIPKFHYTGKQLLFSKETKLRDEICNCGRCESSYGVSNKTHTPIAKWCIDCKPDNAIELLPKVIGTSRIVVYRGVAGGGKTSTALRQGAVVLVLTNSNVRMYDYLRKGIMAASYQGLSENMEGFTRSVKAQIIRMKINTIDMILIEEGSLINKINLEKLFEIFSDKRIIICIGDGQTEQWEGTPYDFSQHETIDFLEHYRLDEEFRQEALDMYLQARKCNKDCNHTQNLATLNKYRREKRITANSISIVRTNKMKDLLTTRGEIATTVECIQGNDNENDHYNIYLMGMSCKHQYTSYTRCKNPKNQISIIQ